MQYSVDSGPSERMIRLKMILGSVFCDYEEARLGDRSSCEASALFCHGGGWGEGEEEGKSKAERCMKEFYPCRSGNCQKGTDKRVAEESIA